jgi:hypothetical protein
MAAWLPLPSGFTGYATRFVVRLALYYSDVFLYKSCELERCFGSRLHVFGLVSWEPRHLQSSLLLRILLVFQC